MMVKCRPQTFSLQFRKGKTTAWHAFTAAPQFRLLIAELLSQVADLLRYSRKLM